MKGGTREELGSGGDQQDAKGETLVEAGFLVLAFGEPSLCLFFLAEFFLKSISFSVIISSFVSIFSMLPLLPFTIKQASKPKK